MHPKGLVVEKSDQRMRYRFSAREVYDLQTPVRDVCAWMPLAFNRMGLGNKSAHGTLAVCSAEPSKNTNTNSVAATC